MEEKKKKTSSNQYQCLQRPGRRLGPLSGSLNTFETSGNQRDPYLLVQYLRYSGFSQPGEGDGVQGRQAGRRS